MIHGCFSLSFFEFIRVERGEGKGKGEGEGKGEGKGERKGPKEANRRIAYPHQQFADPAATSCTVDLSRCMDHTTTA